MVDQDKGTEGKESMAPSSSAEGASGTSASDAVAGAARQQASSEKSKAPLLWGVLGLGIAAGFAMGWFSQHLPLNQTKKEAGVAVKARDDKGIGPCKAWTDTICGRMGELAYECTHARAASAMLPDAACVQAQESVLAKLDAVKAERVQCNQLTSKLCTDLGPEGKGCELARAKEPSFSIEDCQDMTKSYRRVLAQMVERQENGTLPSPPRAPRNVAIAKPN